MIVPHKGKLGYQPGDVASSVVSAGAVIDIIAITAISGIKSGRWI